MSRTLNKVQIIGHLGKDVELRYTSTGLAVSTFTVATNRAVRQADGSYVDEPEWHTVVAWEKLAETCNQFLHRGSKVYIEGRLQTRSWEQDGGKRYRTEIMAGEMIMLDPRSDSGEGEARPAIVGVGVGPDDGIPF